MRYVITNREVAGAPQYTIDVKTWKTGADFGSDEFSAKLPSDAKKIEAADLPDYDELSAIFAVQK